MTKTGFDQLVEETERSHPLWFQLDREPPATAEAIGSLEAVLGLRLPPEHRDFLMTHGAGLFAFADVLGVRPGTVGYLPASVPFVGDQFVPAVDTGSGDFYGFRRAEGACSPGVVYWDHDSSRINDTEYMDFYELVADVGLRP